MRKCKTGGPLCSNIRGWKRKGNWDVGDDVESEYDDIVHSEEFQSRFVLVEGGNLEVVVVVTLQFRMDI